jgi:hypothetical protein
MSSATASPAVDGAAENVVRSSQPKGFLLKRNQYDSTGPAPLAKIFLFSPDPNHLFIPCVPPLFEGRFAIVTDVGGGMRWTLNVPTTNGA